MLAKTTSIDKSKIFEEVQLDEVMLEARTEAINHYPGFNIEIIISDKVESQAQLKINGIPTLLKVAFVNLLENACKFSTSKFVNVEFDINLEGLLEVSIKILVLVFCPMILKIFLTHLQGVKMLPE